MTLFYPAQMSGGARIHLLAIHIAVLLIYIYIFFFLLLFMCIYISDIYNSSRDISGGKHLYARYGLQWDKTTVLAEELTTFAVPLVAIAQQNAFSNVNKA